MVFISILLLIYNLTIIFPYITNIKTFSFLSIGLPSTGQSLSVTNKAKAPQAAAAGGGGPPSDADADLEARLENLRRQ